MENPFEGSLVEVLLALGSAQEKGTATDVVDLAGHALGMVVDAAEKTVAEELALILGDAEVMFDVTGGLLQVEGFEVEANGDALGPVAQGHRALMERLVGSQAEFVSQVRLGRCESRREVSSFLAQMCAIILPFTPSVKLWLAWYP